MLNASLDAFVSAALARDLPVGAGQPGGRSALVRSLPGYAHILARSRFAIGAILLPCPELSDMPEPLSTGGRVGPLPSAELRFEVLCVTDLLCFLPIVRINCKGSGRGQLSSSSQS
jgi:hypothetical protein